MTKIVMMVALDGKELSSIAEMTASADDYPAVNHELTMCLNRILTKLSEEYRARQMEGAEKQLCPQRVGHSMAHLHDTDFWRVEKNGERTCSFCGSIHPDDFRAFVGTVDGIERSIEMADRKHKIYLARPEIKNAGDGPIKYYLAHNPVVEGPDGPVVDELWAKSVHEALVLSNKKMEERVKSIVSRHRP